MTAILTIPIPVGSELLPTAFALKAVDGIWIFPDLVPILVPPLSPANILAETFLPASVWLDQLGPAVRANGIIFCHALHVGLDRFPVPVQVMSLAVVSHRIPRQI